MNKPKPPTPPPMREYRTGFVDVRVNDYKDVEWYTAMGKPYPYERVFPKSWFFRLFMSEDQKKLEEAIELNKACMELQ